MTLAEYLQTPETVLPQELIFGALRVADAPFAAHQRAVLDFLLALTRHVDERSLGEVFVSPIDVILDADRALVLQPDLLFISRERSKIVIDRIYGAPDLVVEVLSPNPRIGRLDERVQWFAQYGVREIWLFHKVERRLELVTCVGGCVAGRETFGEYEPIRSTLLPDFGQAVSAIVRSW